MPIQRKLLMLPVIWNEAARGNIAGKSEVIVQRLSVAAQFQDELFNQDPGVAAA